MNTNELLGFAGQEKDPQFPTFSKGEIQRLRAQIEGAYNQIKTRPAWADVEETGPADNLHYVLTPDQHAKLVKDMGVPNIPDTFPVTRRNRLILVRNGMKPQSLMTSHVWNGMVPRQVQVVTSSFFTRHDRSWCTNGMRSGKTLSAIAAALRLIRTGELSRVLIIAPLSILNEAWGATLDKVNPFGTHVICQDGSKKTRAILKDRPPIAVVNPDKARYLKNEIIGYSPQLIICDESTSFKHMDTSRTACLREIIQTLNCWLWALTAFPITKLATEIYPLGSIINPDMPGFYVWERETTGRANTTKNIRFPLRDEIVIPQVRKLLTPVIGYPTAACIDLPDQFYIGSETTLTVAQEKAIQDLEDMKGCVVDGRWVSGMGQAKRQKVVQILAGAVRVSMKNKDDIDNFATIDCFDRVHLLTSMVQEEIASGNKKIIVFCPFIGGQYVVRDKLGEAGIKSQVLNGKSAPSARDKLLKRFREEDDQHVLIVHPEVGKVGLDLSLCNVSIWFIPPVSTDQWIQGNGRAQGERTAEKDQTVIRYIFATLWEKEMFKRLAKLQTTAILTVGEETDVGGFLQKKGGP